jgi:hypothetical protein
MRILILARPKFYTPVEQFLPLMQGFTAWREQYRSKMETFFFFAGASGGGGIVNVENELELAWMMTEWPLTPFSEIEAIPIIDGDEALLMNQEIVQQMMQRMGQQG